VQGIALHDTFLYNASFMGSDVAVPIPRSIVTPYIGARRRLRDFFDTDSFPMARSRCSATTRT
jgi:hypothetical protein